MWEGKVREQQRARQLRAKGRSLNEISRLLQVSKSSVSIWVRDIQLTELQQYRLNERKLRGAADGRRKISAQWREYHRNNPRRGPNFALRQNLQRIRQFFGQWSADMAYVLGFFAADGCMYHSANGGYSTGGYYTVFNSTDLQLLQTTQSLIGIRNKIEAEKRPAPHKTKYFIRIVNKQLYVRLSQLGMTPRKSLTLSFPKVPEEFLADFVRGYLDGDGCVHFGGYKRKDSGQYRRILMVRFTCGSRKFLEVLEHQLSMAAGVGRGSLHPHTSAWDLSYGTHDARQLYYFMYPSSVPCLERKKRIFEKALKVLGP